MNEQIIKILLIEEDISYDIFIRSIINEGINISLFDIRSAKTVEGAIQALRDEQFDIILLDASFLDKEKGESFSNVNAFARKTPIVILCEYEQRNLATEAVKRGAKDYFVKKQIDENTLPILLVYTVKHKKTEEALHVSEKRFKTIIEHSSDIIAVLDANGKFNYTSLSLTRDFNYVPEDFANKIIFDFIHPEDKEKTIQNYTKIISFRDTSHSMEFRFYKKDEGWRNFEAIGRSILDDNGRPTCILNCRDITERIKQEEELKKLSLIDELTSLHNRRGFLTLVHQQMKLANRNKEHLYVLFADVDKLKWINDLYGHDHGDILIKEAAKVLKSTFRDVDVVARLGGDEFAVVLIQAKEEGIDVIRKRLQERINVCNVTASRPYRLSMSIGVVRYEPDRPASIEELITQADKLMYEQKKGKKNYKVLLGHEVKEINIA